MYLLSAFAAGLVRCFYIDRLGKLSEGIGCQLREGAVFLYPLNKLLDILCLLLLFMDSLLQTLDLSLEVFLFLGVVFAHHGEASIIQLSGDIVLINADEQTVLLNLQNSKHSRCSYTLRFLQNPVCLLTPFMELASNARRYPLVQKLVGARVASGDLKMQCILKRLTEPAGETIPNPLTISEKSAALLRS